MKLWSFYVDLLENMSTVENTKAAYERMIELKIATPQLALNYTRFLQDNSYFEEAFRIYERSLEIFPWPHNYELWVSYL